jgi:competence protein ComEC
MKKLFSPLIFFFAILTLVVCFVYLALHAIPSKRNPTLLTVAYLDVGQGDASFIESPRGTQVLIDGGRDISVIRRLPTVMGYFDRSIDIVIATHPDADHIGGLIDVLKRYDVASIVMTDNINDTPAYEAFLDAVRKENTTMLYAKRGQVIDLGMGDAGSTTLTLLFPDRDVRDLESNTSSIVSKLSYGDMDFLFTGDSPLAIESYLVELDGALLESEVLKAGHHGSRTSSGEDFVTAVQPRYGIISAGKDNDYGHPHKEVMDTFRAHNVETKNTADVGSIFMESDGVSLWIR